MYNTSTHQYSSAPLAMARSAAAVLLLSLALAAVAALLAAPRVEAITCGQVANALRPCSDYVSGKVKTVSAGCCSGVRSLNSAAKTTADRQTACKCLKSLVPSSGAGNARNIPGSCGVNIGYPISPSTNCDTVK